MNPQDSVYGKLFRLLGALREGRNRETRTPEGEVEGGEREAEEG